MPQYTRLEKLLVSFLYRAAEHLYFHTEDEATQDVAEHFMRVAPRASWDMSARFDGRFAK